MKKWLLVTAIAVSLAGMAIVSVGVLLLLRPDPWQMQTLRTDGTDKLYRVHRTDGRMEVMTRNGWRPVTRPTSQVSIDTSKLPLLSCDEYQAMKADRPHSARNADLFYRLPANCP